MIRVHAEAVKSLNSAAAESKRYNDNTLDSGRLKWQTPIKNILFLWKVWWRIVVELDQMKVELQAYKTPLAEVRDSL